MMPSRFKHRSGLLGLDVLVHSLEKVFDLSLSLLSRFRDMEPQRFHSLVKFYHVRDSF
jgi:hypothetical protein